MDHYPMLFVAETPLMVRTPLLPVEALLPLLTTAWDSAACWQEDLALESACIDDLEAVRRGMLFLLEQSPFAPAIREALLLASPDLFHALVRLQHPLTSRRAQKTALRVFRYLVRMTVRCTPFGLFAGVTTGQPGAQTCLHLPGIQAYRTHTRVDMQWLLACIRQIEQDGPAADHLRWTPNTLLYRSGTRIMLPYAHVWGQEKAEIRSVRATPFVLALLETAQSAPTRQELKQQLCALFPDHTAVDMQVDQLCEADFLVSELRPALTDVHPLATLLARVPASCLAPDAPQYTAMQDVMRACQHYDRLPLGQGEEALHRLLARSDDTPVPPLRLATDLSTGNAVATLSPRVLSDLSHAALLLLRLSPHPVVPREIQAYHTLFGERYGSMRLVPLLELLDDVDGLGAPPSYAFPERRTPMLLPADHQTSERERWLFHLASTALRDHQHEVCLQEDQLAHFEADAHWSTHLPASLDLFCSLAASSPAAIEQGQYLLCIGPRVGAAPAGRTFGRWCDVLGEETHALLQRLAQDEERREPQTLFAELVYLPPRGHAANVALRPAIRRYEIVIAASASGASTPLPLETLAVGMTAERLFLWSQTHQKEVVICNTHLLNLSHHTPNIVRFLATIAGRHAPQLHPFEWGACEALPFLPRLRYQSIVLSPARWRFVCEEPQGSGVDTDHLAAWYQQVQRWRAAWRVPRYVSLLKHDQTLLLDLDNPLSCLDLLEGSRQDGTKNALWVQEALPGPEHAWASGETGHFMSEWVVPLRRHPATAPSSAPSMYGRTPLITSEHRWRLLGSDWTSVKLYGREEGQRDLLVGPLHLYLQSMMQHPHPLADWFFVSYHDPQPHLRLRLRSDPGVLCSHLLPPLLGWLHLLCEQGWIAQYTFAGYEREIERYGGLEMIAWAEHCFTVDSQYTLALHRFLHPRAEASMAEPEGFSVHDLALLSIETLLTGLGLDRQQRSDFYRAIAPAHASSPSVSKSVHRAHKQAQRLLGDAAWRRSQPWGQHLDQLAEEAQQHLIPLRAPLAHLLPASQASVLASLVHMHCNRLLLTKGQEEEAIAVLARVLHSFSCFVPPGMHGP